MPNSIFKKTLASKFLEFQKNGLLKYLKYLEQQIKMSSKKVNRDSYKAYLEKEILSTNKKISTIEDKLRK